eukprot:5739753-Amphidinium_carterae.3
MAALKELAWPAIVHSRVGKQELRSDVWYITAQSQPPLARFSWAGHAVLIKEATREQIQERRAQRIPKTKPLAPPGLQIGEAPRAPEVAAATQVDPLTQEDAWGRYRAERLNKVNTSKALAPSVPPRPFSAAAGSQSSQERAVATGYLERGHAVLEEGQKQLLAAQKTTDGNVKDLGAQIGTQFQEVLRQLAELNSVKKPRHQE